MASDENGGRLSYKQIGALAAVISAKNMETIATGYMGIPDVRITQIKEEEDGVQAVNRAIIRTWANMNSRNQVQVSDR